ncbi:hypothetical protein [Mesonia maritima]|uniref:Cytoskeletal protein RodZ n=1 Tax=Mesonia maritima TaxID=1793873 RepID=A0ABU1K282_9FLAO|nr:hypothetical protein [Mesonia maritima]MDR6299715.1 cytoskeletal protein RodZ [Mesonia maritima]
MKEKKYIDRIFQEKFKDFEANPDEKVWNNIKEKLQEKKKKRPVIIPLWYKIGGVAAVLIGILLVSNALFFSVENEPNIVNSSEEKIEKNTNSTEESFSKTETKNTINSTSNSSGITYQDNEGEEIISTEKENENIQNKKSVSEKSIVSSKENTSTKPQEKNYTNQTNSTKNRSGIASVNSSANQKNNTTENGKINSPSNSNSTEEMLQNELKSNSDLLSLSQLEAENMLPAKKRSLLDEVEEMNKEKDIESDDADLAKWAVKPNISPIYYGSLNGGNTIDAQFADNSSEGEVTMAYGVNFAYAISEKFKVRSGISKVNMSYNTNDIVFTSSLNAMSLDGLKGNESNKNILVLDQKEISGPPEFKGRGTPFTTGTINQRLGFLEIPLEMEYTLLNKRFNINVIGGASTLVLSENTIAINSAEGSTALGEANNLNNVSFSTNVGLGFGYELSKKLDFNLEPTFKYQINTFSKNTNGFMPYFFGVYTGFNFKF